MWSTLSSGDSEPLYPTLFTVSSGHDRNYNHLLHAHNTQFWEGGHFSDGWIDIDLSPDRLPKAAKSRLWRFGNPSNRGFCDIFLPSGLGLEGSTVVAFDVYAELLPIDQSRYIQMFLYNAGQSDIGAWADESGIEYLLQHGQRMVISSGSVIKVDAIELCFEMP
ncbi:hypothetical protein NKR23_g3540 [Pleurostoma richardsiae]|uniref:Uncharacterized protein n=1 Tax=Pleurostoma richardsiae TaxID=41990 RepID=A0AA38VTX2_9PEZI|nr:hypothetical protein NKR23_g3540 [Pleurostoma richardsiae]